MITRFINVRRIDPTQPNSGALTDLFIKDQHIVAGIPGQCAPDRTIDMDGCYALAGGIDLHTHIGGGKVNLARLLMQDYLNDSHPNERGPLWSTEITGQKYASMGYTACFEPAMLLPQARATHLQLADTPHLDSGAYVVMGNEDWLLRALSQGLEAKLLQDLVRWTVAASRALAVKVVNAGGIDAFKYHQQPLDIDQPHKMFGVTPRTVIRELAAAVDEIGLAHPLHVHASNLGMPGNILATLATLDAAEGRRLHLTHAQFNCYTDSGPFNMGSGSTLLADRLNRSPELSLDVGQIVFGQTVTLSADTAAQFRNSRHARPAKSIISDVECVGGCGIVPIRYQSRQYVSSLQWTIGLELLLLIRNPYQVLLTTDHPNGGPFTSYPHLIRLLMDRSFRQQMISQLHPLVADNCLLRELDREYTLDEVAILTRAAPAALLGLSQRGHLRPGGLADVVFYQPCSDWETTFSTAHCVLKAGQQIVRSGHIIAHAPQQRIWAEHCGDASLPKSFREAIEQTLRMPAQALELQDDEFAEPANSWLDRAGAL